ncbi:DUF3630 family protein [Vibrio chagasii]|nr:DUF3630 family protein [Vibrio chagasii]
MTTPSFTPTLTLKLANASLACYRLRLLKQWDADMHSWLVDFEGVPDVLNQSTTVNRVV